MAIIWTLDEAEAAWKEGRTEPNLAEWFRRLANESMSCSHFVDRKFVRVVVCLDEEVKQRILLAEASDKESTKQERQKAMEEQWRRNGCVKDSSGNWEVPYELIWRSLPRGEDR